MKALKIPLITILCLTILATQVSAAYPPSIYLYDLPATATYTIKTDGTNYWYVRSDGFTATSTNASYLIASALYLASTTGGGTVLLRSGTYILTRSLVLYNKTALVGESRDSVKLVNNCPSTMHHGLLRNQHYINTSYPTGPYYTDYNITIRSLTIDGNRAGRYGFGIALGNVRNVNIDNVRLCNVHADTINFNGLDHSQGGIGQGNGTAYNVRITNCEIENAGVDGIALNCVTYGLISDYYCNGFGKLGSGSNNGHAITFAGNSRMIEVVNVIARNSTLIDASDAFGSAGIIFFGGNRISITNAYVYDVEGDGIHVEEAGSTNPLNIQLLNCHVENATGESYSFKNTYYLQMDNCWAVNAGWGNATSTEKNVWAYNTEHSIFTNLILKDNQATHSTQYAIVEDATCDRNIWTAISIDGYRTGNYTFSGTNGLTDNIQAVT